VGQPVCFVLTVLRRLGGIFGRGRTPTGRPEKILFIKLIEQGSTVLAHQALRRAVEMVGRGNVYFWVFEENRFILDAMNIVPGENVIVIRTNSLARTLLDMLGSARRIRRMGIDATVDMEFFSRASAILAWLTGAGRRVGLHRFGGEGPYRGDLMTHRMHYNPYLHTSLTFLSFVEALEAPPDQTPMLKSMPGESDSELPRFTPSAEQAERVRGTLERLFAGPVPEPLVLLNPNASDLLPLRRWAGDRFVELGRMILGRHPQAGIAVTGAPAEAAPARDIARRIHEKRAVCMAGETTLDELLVLYTLADVLVTNDSGPAHFAALTDIDVVTLFGPETPKLYAPLTPRSHPIWAGLACSPCVNVFNHRFSPCDDNKCMQVIQVDRVYEAVRDVLSSGQRT
jgi:ADP-heptose:LPS heptosyltransferase